MSHIPQKIVNAMLVLGMLLASLQTYALIHGVTYSPENVSTISVTIQHAHFLRSTGQWEPYQSKCSATIVGVQPLTLLTAAHCLREVKLDVTSGLPEVSIDYPRNLGIDDAKITQAFYRPYEAVAEDLTLDIAILVFQAAVSHRIQPVSIQLTARNFADTLLLCGFGKGYREVDTVHPRCSERQVMFKHADFNQVLPQAYQHQDEMLHLKSKAQFEYAKELAHSEDALIAVNRLNQHTRYAEGLPMLTEGDSGGPWLMPLPSGGYQLVAITSFVERFYNKSAHWDFFDKDVPLSDYPYIAYGLRLTHPNVLAYLHYAKHSGADIRFSP